MKQHPKRVLFLVLGGSGNNYLVFKLTKKPPEGGREIHSTSIADTIPLLCDVRIRT